MAKQKGKGGTFVVLWVMPDAASPGFEMAMAGLKDAEDCQRWIKQSGSDDETYQKARFCGRPQTVKVEKVEKRIVSDAGADTPDAT